MSEAEGTVVGVFVEPKISMDKQYTTRDGREARVVCTDRQGNDKPVVALVKSKRDGIEYMAAYAADGRDFLHRSDDLIEVKPKRTVEIWLNHYKNCSFSHQSKNEAKYNKGNDCIATTHHTITFEEGEGL